MLDLITGRPEDETLDGWPPLLNISVTPMRFGPTSPGDVEPPAAVVVEAPKHLAYGYIRAEDPDEIEIALLRKDMAQFCREASYRLVGVAVDRGSEGSELARTGFAAALATLELPEMSVLVLPTLSHLSDDPVVRQGLLRMVARTGAEVLTTYRESPTSLRGRAELAAARRRHPSNSPVWLEPRDLGGAAS